MIRENGTMDADACVTHGQMDDNAIALTAKNEDMLVLEYILKNYKNFAKSRALSYFLIRSGKENTVQEGMIGLYKAICDFSEQHIRRVVELTKILIENMLTKKKYRDILIEERYSDIIRAVILHDIGKVGIPDNVLLKPGKLTDEEFEIMKTHTTVGADIINSISHDMSDDQSNYLRHCRDIALYHHERWDGKGYMNHLSGNDIPISARIVSVIDVYDAVANKRCYKDAVSHEETVNIIVGGRGTQFDSDILDCFLEVSEEFAKLTEELRD